MGVACALVGALGCSRLVGAIAGRFPGAHSGMRRYERVDCPDGHSVRLSLVPWQPTPGMLAEVGHPGRPSFVPAFELAAFADEASLLSPIVVVDFADETCASSGWDTIVSAANREGIRAVAEYVAQIRQGDLREFGQINAPALSQAFSSHA